MPAATSFAQASQAPPLDSQAEDIALATLTTSHPEAARTEEDGTVVSPVLSSSLCSTAQADGDPSVETPSPITKVGFSCLLAQHASSSWNARTCEFAFYLYLIIVFPDTLIPASILGFCSTGVSILFAGYTGGLVDRHRRLRIWRFFTLAQRFAIICSCAAFLGLFLDVPTVHNYRDAPTRAWVAFAAIVVLGCVLALANIGIAVAVERDWVSTIARPHGDQVLTRLNAWMRRIDLLTKLLAPLFTSLLTTTVSYPFAVAFQMGFAALSLVFELWWVNIVFKRFPMLHETITSNSTSSEADGVKISPVASPERQRLASRIIGAKSRLVGIARDWREFSKMPVFASTLAVSLLYLTVLSFDGTMLSYLKSRNYNDAFVAGQRGICVVTGLLGTILMPWLEKKIGLVRAGAWSITSELFSLAPVIASFFVATPAAADGPAWSAALLFGGMAASRIGLWAFDLCQLKELQLALDEHPKKNRFMGLQFSMQNIADLAKYVLTLVLSRPREFRYAALVSFISVAGGVVSYSAFVRQERKHLFHFAWLALHKRD